jgi:hypothetical protein
MRTSRREMIDHELIGILNQDFYICAAVPEEQGYFRLYDKTGKVLYEAFTYDMCALVRECVTGSSTKSSCEPLRTAAIIDFWVYDNVPEFLQDMPDVAARLGGITKTDPDSYCGLWGG